MRNKKGLEMSFAWLFAIIVGAIILLLAIYASTRIINTEQTSLDARTAKEIGVLLDPLETSFETGKSNSMILPTETRIYNRCNNEGVFGRQIIKVSQKTLNQWTETDVNVAFQNKIIFSDNFVEGKKFFLFSKPFEFPFKVADVIYLTSSNKKYCFINAPKNVENELSNLNQENLFIKNCPTNSTNICFESSSKDCSVFVSYGGKYVEKNGLKLYFYSDALMYAAVFSDKDIYECQLKRVMQRSEQTSTLYTDKSQIVSQQGCSSNLDTELRGLTDAENGFNNSADLNDYMIGLAENINSKNKISGCRLW